MKNLERGSREKCTGEKNIERESGEGGVRERFLKGMIFSSSFL